MSYPSTATSYPGREPFFAHRLVRLLTKTAAAQELGPEVTWLLTVIAHTEDAKRYTGAVSFWNEQLMPLCGFRSKGRLVRARQAAIDAGWLHYAEGDRTQPGRYWCLIPESFSSLSDGSCDESDPFQNRTANGPGERSCGNEIERQTDQKSNGKRTTFYPIPKPILDKSAAVAADASSSGRKRQRQTLEPIPLPPALDTPEARTALDEWRQHRREKHKPLTPTAERKLLTEWSAKGAARFVAAVNQSITSGWQGLFEPDLSRFPHATPAGSAADADAVIRQHTAEALARNRPKLEAQRAARQAREGATS